MGSFSFLLAQLHLHEEHTFSCVTKLRIMRAILSAIAFLALDVSAGVIRPPSEVKNA